MKMTGMATNEVVTTEPQPTTITVCDQCGEDWDGHFKFARKRAYDDYYRSLGHWTEAVWEDAQRAKEEAKPGLIDCIQMLKIANQGPVGPVGMAGADGHTPQVYVR